ncbi:MAG: hypothetical protein M3Y65_21085 [Pseudomonadota bacterium]|nr:hypothetical protein [Pseudomonadota bacterium]
MHPVADRPSAPVAQSQHDAGDQMTLADGVHASVRGSLLDMDMQFSAASGHIGRRDGARDHDHDHDHDQHEVPIQLEADLREKISPGLILVKITSKSFASFSTHNKNLSE